MDPGGRAAILTAEAATDHTTRLERARAALASAGAAGLILVPGSNLMYFTSLHLKPSERLLAFLVPREGEPLLVAPSFERPRLFADAPDVKIAAWAEDADPFELAARFMRSSGWLLDPTAPFWVAEGLRERVGVLRSAEGLCAALRRRKEPRELELLSRAQHVSRETLHGLRRTLEAGVTERELAAEILARFSAAGLEGWAHVQFGASSALPHHESADAVLPEESAVLIDLGAVEGGYHADLTRAWWHGERPPPDYVRAATAVTEAQAEAAALAQPGVAAQELDRAARRRLARDGLDRHFLHRVGHGVGLDIHEPPFLVEGNVAALEVADVVTIEPGVYLEGRFGLRHEDVWQITEDGARKI